MVLESEVKLVGGADRSDYECVLVAMREDQEQNAESCEEEALSTLSAG